MTASMMMMMTVVHDAVDGRRRRRWRRRGRNSLVDRSVEKDVRNAHGVSEGGSSVVVVSVDVDLNDRFCGNIICFKMTMTLLMMMMRRGFGDRRRRRSYNRRGRRVGQGDGRFRLIWCVYVRACV